MATTTLFASQDPEIISKGTFTLNVRVKRQTNVEQEAEESLNNKLSNSFLQETSSKSNITFQIQDQQPDPPKKKTISPILKIGLVEKKKSVSIIKKIDVAREQDLTIDINTNINSVDSVDSVDSDDDTDLEDNMLVKKIRIMGVYFWVGIELPYIYCTKSFKKVGIIKEDRDIEWLE